MRRIALLLALGLCAPGCHQNLRPRWEVSLSVGTTSKVTPETTVTTSLVLKRPVGAAASSGKIGIEAH